MEKIRVKRKNFMVKIKYMITYLVKRVTIKGDSI